MRLWIAAPFALLAILLSCRGRHLLPNCPFDPRLVGTWKTAPHSSQLGRSIDEVSFSCDCTWSATIQLIDAKITDSRRGTFRIEQPGVMTLKHDGGTSMLQYSFSFGELITKEHEDGSGDRFVFRRVRTVSCAGT